MTDVAFLISYCAVALVAWGLLEWLLERRDWTFAVKVEAVVLAVVASAATILANVVWIARLWK